MKNSADETFAFHPLLTGVILNKLYDEYESILWRRKIRLKKCLIEIVSNQGFWGQWDPGTRTIRLSQRLLDRYEWTTVVEILKHEMAHQYVTEAYPIKDSHGKSFKMACEALGVVAWARTASGELPDEIPSWRTAKLSSETQRQIERMNKLLSLASSTNEHEAALAMERAQEISARHHLERLEQPQAAECDYWFVPFKKSRVDAPTKIIFSILRAFYFVRPIFTSYFDVKEFQTYKAYDVAGRPEDLQMAEYVYEFLVRTLENLWRDHQAKRGVAGSAKRSYCMGVLAGFQAKLSEAQAKRTAEPSSKAIIALDKKELADFLRYRYPVLASGSGISGARDGESYTAGLSDGRNIVLSKPITTQNGNQGRLLGSN